MDIIKEAMDFEKAKMSHMSMSNRVATSREAKRLILTINEVFKDTKDPGLMDIMKLLTAKKRNIEKRLHGRPSATI